MAVSPPNASDNNFKGKILTSGAGSSLEQADAVGEGRGARGEGNAPLAGLQRRFVVNTREHEINKGRGARGEGNAFLAELQRNQTKFPEPLEAQEAQGPRMRQDAPGCS